MEKTNTNAEKIFMGLGIVAWISGMFLAFEGNYLGGICGGIVGAWLAFENWKKIKSKKKLE